ncbi:MAG: adenine nucleotide alpha hydrolase family protein [Methanobacteriota archaeon]|nr:MAG: adenine nucleotide alpha hydrolase family protein [Euryarchaeota archaeon]
MVRQRGKVVEAMKPETYLSRVSKTISKFKLVEEGDVIFVALSGGGDSASALFTLKSFVDQKDVDCELKGFHIDLGFPSGKTLDVVKGQTDLVGVELVTVSTKELGVSFPDVVKKTSRPVCSVCGVLKRYVMNKIPREMGANKIATGHHMDDFLVFFFKNVISQNFFWISKFKPKLESSHPKMLCRIRPLFFVGGKETRDFCESMGIPFVERESCPHTSLDCYTDLNRAKWYETLYQIEKKHKNFRCQMARSIVKMNKFFAVEASRVVECPLCGEPTNQETCSFCRLFKGVK